MGIQVQDMIQLQSNITYRSSAVAGKMRQVTF